MKWKSNSLISPRIRRCFAFLPIRLDDGFNIWLEHYWVIERWCEHLLYWRSVVVTKRRDELPTQKNAPEF